MGRLFFFGFEGVAGLVLLGLWIWAIFDVISTDEAMIRNLPKVLWLLLVIILPTVGSGGLDRRRASRGRGLAPW